MNVSSEPKLRNTHDIGKDSSFNKPNFRIRTIALNEKDNTKKVTGERLLNIIYPHKKAIVELSLSKIVPRNANKNQPPPPPKPETNSNAQASKIKEETTDYSHVIETISNTAHIDHVITKDEETHILQALSNHFVFRDITQEVLSLVLNDLIYFIFEQDQLIYDDGDEGNYFYIIAQGRVEAVSPNKKSRIFTTWECFGELSLITQCKREERIKCLEKVIVFALDGESFRDFRKRINEEVLKERFNFLNTIAIFRSLDNISKYNVADKIKLRSFNQSEQIISRGDLGDNLYIIKDGLVSCRIGIKEVRKLGNNDYFGQNAILLDEKRTLDIFALRKTMCYELNRQDLRDALGANYIDVILFCFFRNCIENSPLKDIVSESVMEDVYKCFQIKQYSKNDQITTTSADGGECNNKRLIIVIEGSIYKEKSFELLADKGKILGEELLLDFNKTLPENIIAHPDCISLEANVDVLLSKMKINIHEEKPLHVLNRINKLKKLYLFKHLSEFTLEKLANHLKKQKYEPNEVIVEENTPGNSFFLISKGRVRVSMKGKILRDLDSGNSFGENVLLTSDNNRTATVTAVDDVVCYELHKNEFDLIMGDTSIKQALIKKLSLQDTSITLQDLHYIKFLGKGKFGSVSLVHNKKNIYAIKAVSRASVDCQKILAKYFVNERKVMLSLDHPFVVKMVKSMRNMHFCFFLMEYVNGKSLDDHLSTRLVKNNIFETQFYIGSLFLILEYLQSKYIAHRDIKPSNIMIDSNGYLKMIDFGTAKILTDYTSTVIGTPHYIAPEILRGKGYSTSCDFWSVGICMFEIFYGMYPFGHFASEVIEIYKDILHQEFFFPSENEKYASVNSLIRNLLTKKVNQRCCNITLLKHKPFFNEFDWTKLNDFKLIPPFVPPQNDLSVHLDKENHYENYVKEDHGHYTKKNNKDSYTAGYDRRWAEEF